MALIKIDLGELKAAVGDAENTAQELNSYAQLLNDKIKAKLGDMAKSNDADNNVSSALSSVNSKISSLKSEALAMSKLGSDLSSFRSKAKDTDKAVGKNINAIADCFKRPLTLGNIWKGFKSSVYNFFCVSLPSTLKDVFPGIGNITSWIRKTCYKLSVAMSKLKEFFVYGAGKYIVNIIKGAAALIGALALLITAAAGSSVILVVIGVLSGCVALIYGMIKFSCIFEDSMRAYKLHRQGDKGLAHYYGGTDDVQSSVEKRDYGGKIENGFTDLVARGTDFFGKASEKIRDLAITCEKIFGYAEVKGFNGDVVDRDYSFSNIRKNYRRKKYEDLMEKGFIFRHSGQDNEIKAGFSLSYLVKKSKEKGILKYFLEKDKYSAEGGSTVEAENYIDALDEGVGFVKDIIDRAGDFLGMNPGIGSELKSVDEKLFGDSAAHVLCNVLYPPKSSVLSIGGTASNFFKNLRSQQYETGLFGTY